MTRVTLKWRGNVLFRSVNNPAFGQIIWRHFDEHLVAGEHTELPAANTKLAAAEAKRKLRGL